MSFPELALPFSPPGGPRLEVLAEEHRRLSARLHALDGVMRGLDAEIQAALAAGRDARARRAVQRFLARRREMAKLRLRIRGVADELRALASP